MTQKTTYKLKPNELNWLTLGVHEVTLTYTFLIFQRFQYKILRKLSQVPWYVLNKTLHNDLKILFIKDRNTKFSKKYV